jgi:hypothetical protein
MVKQIFINYNSCPALGSALGIVLVLLTRSILEKIGTCTVLRVPVFLIPGKMGTCTALRVPIFSPPSGYNQEMNLKY